MIKVEMLRAGHTPESLAALLKNSGCGTNTPKALAQRIVRGSFNFGFAVRMLNIMGVRTLDLGYVDPKKHKTTNKNTSHTTL